MFVLPFMVNKDVYITREMSLTQSSVIQTTHCELVSGDFSFYQNVCFLLLWDSYIYSSQGSVAAQLRCCGIFSNHAN